MGIKTKRPTTPTLRYQTYDDFSDVTCTKPDKSLISKLKKSGGRNNLGRMTARYRGGGHKRRYRKIDFKRNKYDIEAKVESIEYDPNRSARIVKLLYKDGERRYIIAPQGIKVGDAVMSGLEAPIQLGNALPLSKIPVGTDIHNIELKKGKGGSIVRSAGSSAVILAKEGNYAQVKLPSNEIRLILLGCFATIGEVSNPDHNRVVLGKAGRKRWLGIRPRTRGTAMNPVDHPMGGGEGRAKGGRHPCSRTGLLAKGYKTRKKKKSSDKYIVSRRK